MTPTTPAERKVEGLLEVVAYFGSCFAAARLAMAMHATSMFPADAGFFVFAGIWFLMGCTAFLTAIVVAHMSSAPSVVTERRSVLAVLNAAGRQGPRWRSRLVNLLLRAGYRIVLVSVILPTYVAAFFLAAWLAMEILDPGYATWSWLFLTLALALALILIFSMILTFLSTVATRRCGVEHLIEDLDSAENLPSGRWSFVGRLMRFAGRLAEKATPLR